MARSNTGGTRGFLRGKIANDLYQVTKDKDGRKIQLVRSVETSRLNPNTIGQALARMQMALCMGSLSQFKTLVDHSWENIPYGQLSIAHFVEVNMPLIQRDCQQNWDGASEFEYPLKGVTSVRLGPFIMSEGSITLPSAISVQIIFDLRTTNYLHINVGKDAPTFGDLRACLGANAGDYITFILLEKAWDPAWDNGIAFRRFYLAQNVPDAQLITTDNVRDMFTYDGNTEFDVALLPGGDIRFQVYNIMQQSYRYTTATCVIVSRWDGKKWCRNNSQFEPPEDAEEPWLDNRNPDQAFASWFPDYNGKSPYLENNG